MNFLLSEIEFHIDDIYFEKAEVLIQNNALLSMDEVERHLWSFKIMDQRIYEVEIQISPSKVKAVSCECSVFKSNNICEHVAMSLILLRKKIAAIKEQKALVKKEKIRKTRINAKLTTNKILDYTSTEDLKDFVKFYAKENRNFSLAFKARFASLVPSADSTEKYSQLIESMLKSVSRDGAKTSASGRKLILNLVIQFIRHSEEAELNQDFSEVFSIFKAVFNKAAIVLHKIQKNKEEFVLLYLDYLSLLRRVLKKDIAPKLKEDIWSFLISKLENGALKKYSLINPIIETLIPLSKTLNKSDELIDYIDILLQESGFNEQDQVHLILAKISLFKLSGNKDKADEFIQQNLEYPNILLMVVEKSIQDGDIKMAQKLATKALADEKYEKHYKQLRDLLLEIAVKSKSNKQIIQLATEQYLLDFELLYYDILKKQKSWPKVFKKLLTSIQDIPFSIQKRDTYAFLLFDNKCLEELFEYIKNIKSFDLLFKYDGVLLKTNRKKVEDLYSTLLQDYLSNHLGRQSAQKVRQVMEHLMKSDENKLAGKLISRFRENYAERHSLMEELEIFR